MKATLTSKGQITLPKKARTQIGLQTGDKLEVHVEGNEIRLVKPTKKINWEAFHDACPPRTPDDADYGKTALEIIDDMRGGPVTPEDLAPAQLITQSDE
ncbi:MAG: AbrB/MazE/SpoVT family DNA-binding domain-containing protein [Verrucomicrobiota bacterium]